jgi:anthranilate 1,2-dioxygenase large subunit
MNMTVAASARAQERRWPEDGDARIPAWIYTDADLFARELDTFHYGPSWNYVGLECELPSPGSFKRSWIGRKSVILVRDEAGAIQVLENRCAHRGSMLCWKNKGQAKDFTCPYHHWSYDLKGNLLGLPFLRGAMGKGGMPRDFDKRQHGLRRLRVQTRGGVVWATFDDAAPALEDFLGQEMRDLVDRSFPGRPLRLLGYNRQLLPCNWKLYFENSRDPYHATLLHSFFVTFGLLRTDTPFRAVPTEEGRHGIMASTYSRATASAQNEVTRQLASLKSDFRLNDMEVVTPVDEFGDSRMVNLSVFPSVFFQQHGNSLAVRHIIPKDVSSTELSWTFFGYADDDEAMHRRRMKQSNLLGPAGHVAVDDSEVLALMQPIAAGSPESVQVVEMGGRDTAPQETMVSETLIRAFYRFYRQKMGL